jgi:hypothetical protein
MDDRSTTITLAGEVYELLFSTKAMKEVNSRYKGKKPSERYKEDVSDIEADTATDELDAFNEEYNNSQKYNEITDDFIWLLTLLINQGILKHNITVIRSHSGEKLCPFTEEEVEILTEPADFSAYKAAIDSAIAKGMTRNVRSEDSLKNVMTG